LPAIHQPDFPARKYQEIKEMGEMISFISPISLISYISDIPNAFRASVITAGVISA
jgi:hypothetical protein